ncbi:MAG: UDP-N-acetylglucosamine--N-acetylmuramyl-(pentapeptide) pyrophosphoryl-undecaprenol N-acetylglucosamine transferase, partial [Candidatus Veblenbacteria bacterium]|nr:UDP-N-acetylglucosamine--N-acetylmuramyl-(pentapeptide) pyrophosphoryl-undecaprenol N-acetylglucosamine transferase [Candidatus Veblenbacteria bacterium]
MRLLCTGGGTLGSVTPLLAVVEELRLRYPDIQVEWWGTHAGPERLLVESRNITFKTISAGKFRRYASLENLKDIIRIATGLVESLWRFGFNRPDCLLTAGSFVAVPAGWAAYLYGIPVLVHQQDVRPSLANRLLSPVASRITVALRESVKDFSPGKVVFTGNPVRSVFMNAPTTAEARRELGLSPDKPTILIIGGGSGAKALNHIALEAEPELLKLGQVIHITGAGKEVHISIPGYLTMPLTNESVTVLAAADVVVTRAGMGVLTELSALGKAAVVVPLPQSHQEDNAKYFSER